MLWWHVPGDEGRRGWQEDERVDKTTPTRWTRVWAKPPLGRRMWLQFTGSWGVGHDLAAEPPAPPRWLSGQESTCPSRQDPQEMGVWSLMLRMTSSGNCSVFQGDSIKNSSSNSVPSSFAWDKAFYVRRLLSFLTVSNTLDLKRIISLLLHINRISSIYKQCSPFTRYFYYLPHLFRLVCD